MDDNNTTRKSKGYEFNKRKGKRVTIEHDWLSGDNVKR